jgi:prevent-host-death family protein
MRKKYSISDARSNLPHVVREAEAGQAVELTRRGHAVAVLLSTAEYGRLRESRRSFAQAYADFRGRYDLEEIGVDESVFLRARDPTEGRKVDL